MPIRIDKYISDERTEIAWLSDEEFDLALLLSSLTEWLLTNSECLEPGDYCADVGFSARDGAAGGGATLSNGALKIMAKIGMALHLSEYPPFAED